MSFGQWLVVILVLLVGLVVGWVVMGRRTAGGPAAPTVEGEPATGAAEADGAVDQERPAAVVDEVPPAAAVTEEPVPAEQDAPPAAATVAAEANTLPSAEPARTADAEPAVAEAAQEPVAAAEEAAVRPATVAAAESTTVDVPAEAEPVAAEAEPATAVADPPEVAPEVVPAPRPAVADAVPAEVDGAADQGAADDFRRIQGIGPKMAAALQGAGIRTYQQLAELDEAALRETIKAAGLRATSSLATWPQQAKVLAGARAEADEVLP